MRIFARILIPGLVLASCAQPQISPDVLRIVPLIKAEKYDEAAAIDPDLLAPAFVEALREMKAEGADPKRIVAVADFFLDQYPLSIRDVAIDEALFESVAEIHLWASKKMKPELPACAKLAAAKTVEEKTDLLRTWEGPHDDGGRCARNLAELLRRALNSGPEWDSDLSMSRSGGEGIPSRLVRDLVEAAERTKSSPYFLVLAMTGSSVTAMYGGGRLDSWGKWGEVLEGGRWSRVFGARYAWWDALRQKPYFNLRSGIEAFEASRFDRRLRELGSALKEASKADPSLDSEPKDLAGLNRALESVVQAGQGTPYPDLLRYALVAALVNSEQTDKAEAWIRQHAREFDYPLRRAYSWLFLCTPFVSAAQIAQSSERVLGITQAAIEAAPGSSSVGEALVLMAQAHLGKGRTGEAIACLEKAVAIPESASGLFEDENAEYARSEAGHLLANLYLERKEWNKSLAAWKSWKPYSMCANGSWDQDLDLSLGIGRCLEELGRRREAADHYWTAVLEIRHWEEPAKRLMEVHRSLGTLPELINKVRKAAERADSSGEEFNEGVKKLAQDLGVPLK